MIFAYRESAARWVARMISIESPLIAPDITVEPEVLVIANGSTTRAIEQKIRKDLLAAQKVFEEFQRLRFAQLLVATNMVAEVPQLKAVVTTPGLDHPTYLDSARTAQQLVHSDLLMLVDNEGRLLASVTEPQRFGDLVTDNPAFASALQKEPFQGIWVTGNGLYQVVASPMLFGEDLAGAVLTGFAINEQGVNALAAMTNCQVALMTPDILVTSSSSQALFEHLRALGLANKRTETAQFATHLIKGERYLVASGRLGQS